MMDCWMALTERYTLELAEAFEPYNVYWIEEALPPDDFEGFAAYASKSPQPGSSPASMSTPATDSGSCFV